MKNRKLALLGQKIRCLREEKDISQEEFAGRAGIDRAYYGGIGYSDKQHKGNVGEGQFHITEKNLQTHLDKYFHKTLTYEELCQLLAGD